MREIALLTLLLLPKWGFLTNFRGEIENYLLPPGISAPAAVETTAISRNPYTIPYKVTDDIYSGAAKATYSLDLASDTTLVEQNIDTRLQVASLTKLMTAYVALKDAKNLDSVITVPNFQLGTNDATVGLVPGDRLLYKDLLAAMLISSGSDAAQAVAILDAGSQTAFVNKMNAATIDIGLTNTHYSNPVGWDNTNNYSSARDVANLSRVLLDNKFFAEIVATKSKSINVSGRDILLKSTNELLGANGFAGVKTGYTEGAGECLSSLEETDGHRVLTVIIGSPNRFGETLTVNAWTKSHFLW